MSKAKDRNCLQTPHIHLRTAWSYEYKIYAHMFCVLFGSEGLTHHPLAGGGHARMVATLVLVLGRMSDLDTVATVQGKFWRCDLGTVYVTVHFISG